MLIRGAEAGGGRRKNRRYYQVPKCRYEKGSLAAATRVSGRFLGDLHRLGGRDGGLTGIVNTRSRDEENNHHCFSVSREIEKIFFFFFFFAESNILVVVVVVVMSDLTLSPYATCVDKCSLQGYVHCSFYSRIAEIFRLCRHAGQVEAKRLFIMGRYDFICVRFDRLREENFNCFYCCSDGWEWVWADGLSRDS